MSTPYQWSRNQDKKFSYTAEIARVGGQSRSFKVADFDINRKPVYDFILMHNTNLLPILHRFPVIALYWSNYRFRQWDASSVRKNESAGNINIATASD